MNDFTKEELERTCQFFNIAIEDFQEPDSTYELRDKVQSMIDNYCEHEFQVKSLAPHFLIMCAKCSKTFVDESFPG
jgi:hypothetical protein